MAALGGEAVSDERGTPVQGLRLRAQAQADPLEFGVWEWGGGVRIQVSGFRVQGSGFRFQGSGFKVQGEGCRM